MANPILLYDGVCGLCNRMTQFVLRRDGEAVFRFAALESAFAAAILARHGAATKNLDTVCIVVNHNQPGEILLPRSDAVVFILRELGGIWNVAGGVLGLFPRPIRDCGYRLIARNRYRIFGRYDSCPLPSTATRARFLDQ